MSTFFLQHASIVLLTLLTFLSTYTSAAIVSPSRSLPTSIYDQKAVASATGLLNSFPTLSSRICAELLKDNTLPLSTKIVTSTQVKLAIVTKVVNTSITKSTTRISTIAVAKTITSTSTATQRVTDTVIRPGQDETQLVPITVTQTRTETYTLRVIETVTIAPTSINLITTTATSFITSLKEVTLGPGTTITITVDTAAPIQDFKKRAQPTTASTSPTNSNLGAKFPKWQLPQKMASIDVEIASQACRNLRAKASATPIAKTSTVVRVTTQTRTQTKTQTTTQTTTFTTVQRLTVTRTTTATAYATTIQHLTRSQTVPGKTKAISTLATDYVTVTSVATGTPSATETVTNSVVVVRSTEIIIVTELVTDGTITITPTPLPVTITTTAYAYVTFTPVSVPNQGQGYWCFSDVSSVISQAKDITPNQCQSKCLEDKSCDWFILQRGQSLTTGLLTTTCTLIKGDFTNADITCMNYGFSQILAQVWAK